jgi:hypothetical protein
MQPPDNTTIYKGEIATYWFEDGILISLSKNPVRTVANITENIALVKRITNNKKVPLLIYLSPSPVPDKETRKFAASQVANVYKAMAMVSKSGLAKIVMNMVFGLKSPTIPMKSFSDDKKAKEWLKQYI